MKFKWEDIFSIDRPSLAFNTARAKVDGGWMIQHTVRYEKNISTALSFLPDEDHEWSIESETLKIPEQTLFTDAEERN